MKQLIIILITLIQIMLLFHQVAGNLSLFESIVISALVIVLMGISYLISNKNK